MIKSLRQRFIECDRRMGLICIYMIEDDSQRHDYADKFVDYYESELPEYLQEKISAINMLPLGCYLRNIGVRHGFDADGFAFYTLNTSDKHKPVFSKT